MKRALSLVLVVAPFAVACGGSDPVAAGGGDGPIVVNEITSLGDANDAVELYNRGTETVDLSNWFIQDEDRANEKTYVIAEGTTLAAGAYLVLEKGKNHAFGFGNTDSVFLVDTDGNVADTTGWTDGQAAVSWCRVPNGTGEFKSCSKATFGAANAE